MAVNDVYQLQFKYRDFDLKPMQNTCFYRQRADGVGGPYPTQAERLARDWILDVWPTIRATLVPAFSAYEIRVNNLFNPTDAYTLPVNIAGTRASGGSENFPSFTNGVVTLALNNAVVKKGRKAQNGLIETDTANGLLQTNGYDNMQARATAWLKSVSTLLGGFFAFEPVVVKRVKYTTPSGSEAYRLPNVIAELVYGLVTSAVTSLLVSHQVSRSQ